MNELITIIIPIYNSAKYLEKCLESIEQQEYSNFECILVNDGSTDSSPMLCEKYSLLDPRFKTYHKKNGGVSSARNFGIEKATGKYLCFIDSDDWVEKDYLKRMIYEIENSDIVISSILEYKFDKIYKSIKLPNLILERNVFFNNFYIYRNSYLSQIIFHSIWNKLYLKNIIDNNRNIIRFDTTISNGEDYIFNLTYFNECNNIKLISNILYNYRINEKSLSRAVNENIIRNILYISDYTKKFVMQNSLIIEKNASYIPFQYRNIYSIVLLLYKSNNMKYNDIESFISKIKKELSLNYIIYYTFPIHIKIVLLLLYFNMKYSIKLISYLYKYFFKYI